MILCPSTLIAEIEIEKEYAVGSKIVATVNDPGKVTILWNAPFLETEKAGNQLFIWGKARTLNYTVDAVVIPLKTIEL